MRASKPFVAFAAGLGVVGLLVFAFAVGLALPRLTAWAARRTTHGPAVTPERLQAELSAGLRLAGSATPESHTEYFGLSYSTYQRWQLDVVLANATRYPLVLGDDLFLIESNADGSGTEGVGYFRGQNAGRPLSFGDGSFDALGEWTFEYPFSNYVRIFTDGSRFCRQGGRVTLSITQRATGAQGRAGEPRDFGRLPAGGRTPVRLTLDEGSWLKPESLASVRVVLPEIAVATANGKERFRLTAWFTRPSGSERSFHVARTELVRIEPLGLARTLESADTNLVTRVFAAHWLAAREGVAAGPALARACGSLRQGELLATGLALLTDTRSSELAGHALELLADGGVPNGIRHRAAVYLGAIGHRPALPALLRAAKDKDDAVARGAIEGLGGFTDGEAVDALLLVLRGRDGERRALAARALARTGDPGALAALHELAGKGQQAAFDALVRAARSESFEVFVALLRGRTKPEWRPRLFRALGRAGGARAVPVLVEFLATDPAPAVEQAVATDSLVDAILETGATPARDGLVRLARSGNLRALQVLAGWPDAAARDVLLERATSAVRAERLIALDGLARHWPKQGRPVLRAAVTSSDLETVEAAIAALGATDDAREVGVLLEPLRRAEPRVRRAAASAIEKLGPGPYAAEVLAVLLETSDRACAASLVDGLVTHGWRDASTTRRIAERLAAGKGDERFELVRLLRHLSRDAMGPADFAAWKKEPERWTERWREWAARS